ncbi:hypothetical protein CBM2599_B50559 [Cupriavidus taiwanensis]|nr:hypothetical protein CBM2600_B10430 [Cupriavidus taiwanensis]SOY96627.1 hypothetical protein CBM2599_B50559 [Cupriavidus taiwanensis]
MCRNRRKIAPAPRADISLGARFVPCGRMASEPRQTGSGQTYVRATVSERVRDATLAAACGVARTRRGRHKGGMERGGRFMPAAGARPARAAYFLLVLVDFDLAPVAAFDGAAVLAAAVLAGAASIFDLAKAK